MRAEQDDFFITDDKKLLDLNFTFGILQTMYWVKDRSWEQFESSVKNSLCFGLYENGSQIGFARAVTDYATFYWLCDVFVLEEYRGRGLGTWLVKTVVESDQLKGLKGLLGTRDAHSLYQKFGFEFASDPRWYMHKPRKS